MSMPPITPMQLPITVSDGKHHQDRDHAGEHQVAHRARAEGADRVDLLGDRHRAELGGDARADAAAHHQGREDGAQLAQQGQADDARHEHLRPEPLDVGAELQRQHHPRGQGRQARRSTTTASRSPRAGRARATTPGGRRTARTVSRVRSAMSPSASTKRNRAAGRARGREPGCCCTRRLGPHHHPPWITAGPWAVKRRAPEDARPGGAGRGTGTR